MVPYYGDFPEDATVYLPFNTFSSDDPSASVTVTDLADADIKVHKNGGLTQIATDGATVAINYDGITGNHLITIDTSVHADYSTGAEYTVRIEGVTIDGATVNAWIGAFSIERSGGALALLKNATYGLDKLVRATTPANTLDISANGNAGIDWGNIDNKTTANDLSATDIQLVDTCTANTDMRGTDSAMLATEDGSSFSAIPDMATATNQSTIAGYIDTEIGDLATAVAAIPTNPMLDTEDGSSFSAVPWNAAWDAEVESECTDALAAINLDHLLKTPVSDQSALGAGGGNEVVDGTIMGAILATGGDPDNFNLATDSLQSIRDELTVIETDTNELQTDDTPGALTAIDAKIDILDAISDELRIALVNKLIITEASGNTEFFNESDVSQGSVVACYATDGTYTTRKRLAP